MENKDLIIIVIILLITFLIFRKDNFGNNSSSKPMSSSAIASSSKPLFSSSSVGASSSKPLFSSSSSAVASSSSSSSALASSMPPVITAYGTVTRTVLSNKVVLYDFSDNGQLWLPTDTQINYFIIGGGGGGSAGFSATGNGGNSGYILYNSDPNYIFPSGLYNITVGNAGKGGSSTPISVSSDSSAPLPSTGQTGGKTSIIDQNNVVWATVNGGLGGKYSVTPTVLTDSQTNSNFYKFATNPSPIIEQYDSYYGQTGKTAGSGFWFNLTPIFISSVIGVSGSGGDYSPTAQQITNSSLVAPSSQIYIPPPPQVSYGNGGQGGAVNGNGIAGLNGRVLIWYYS